MFNVYCKVTKASTVNGEFRISGVASDSSLDRDEEMFTPEAVKAMREDVLSGGVVLRAEHDRGWYAKIGKVVDASINESGQLVIEAVVNKKRSLGQDFIELCNEAIDDNQPLPGFSIGGEVIDADYQYVEAVKKYIKIYKRVLLKEVSLVSEPSNRNVTLELPISKSVDWNKVGKSADIASNEGRDLERLFFKKKNDMIEKDLFKKGILAEQCHLMNERWEASWDIEWDLDGFWCVLLDILKSDARTMDQKEQAIQEYTNMLREYGRIYGMTAEELDAYEVDMMDMEKSLTDMARKGVEKMTMLKVVSDFVRFEKKVTAAAKEVAGAVLNPAELTDGVSYYEVTKAPAAFSEYIKEATAGLKIVKSVIAGTDSYEVTAMEKEDFEKATAVFKSADDGEATLAEELPAKEGPTVEEQHVEAEQMLEVPTEEIEKHTQHVAQMCELAEALIALDSKQVVKATNMMPTLVASLSGASKLAKSGNQVHVAGLAGLLEYGRERFMEYVTDFEKQYNLGIKQDIESCEMGEFLKYVDNFIEAGKTLEEEAAPVIKTSNEPTVESPKGDSESSDKVAKAVLTTQANTELVKKELNKFQSGFDGKVAEVTKSFTNKVDLVKADQKALREEVEKNNKTVERLVGLVEKMANESRGRKSVASSEVAKASADRTPKSEKDLMDENMKNGMSLNEAYAEVLRTRS